MADIYKQKPENAMMSTIKAYAYKAAQFAPAGLVGLLAPVAHADSLNEVVGNATSSFESTTGFSMDSVAQWMWVNLAEPILGSGLGVLYTLRWYIVATIALAIIVYFAFRYFGFFKH